MAHFDAAAPGKVHRVIYERMVADTEGEVCQKYGVTANVVCPRALTRMTETVAGAADFMTGPEWEPENISPLVVFLASDAAADVSGQVFVVFGTRVHLMEGFTLANTVDRGEGRWTPEELIARKDELFAGHRSKVPPMGFGQ